MRTASVLSDVCYHPDITIIGWLGSLSRHNVPQVALGRPMRSRDYCCCSRTRNSSSPIQR